MGAYFFPTRLHLSLEYVDEGNMDFDLLAHIPNCNAVESAHGRCTQRKTTVPEFKLGLSRQAWYQAPKVCAWGIPQLAFESKLFQALGARGR